MPTVTQIDVVGFADHKDVAIKDRGIFTAKKNRMLDIEGVWKATKAYRLDLDEKDMIELIKMSKWNQPTISTEATIKYYIKQGLLPNNKRLFIYNQDWHYNFLTVRGFLVKSDNGLERDNKGSIIVFNIDDFVKLEPTKKEKEILKEVNNRKATQKLNMLVVKDNLLKALNDKGYDCICYDVEMPTIEYKSKKGYNALVKDAIEYYLNNIVLKELGCKITLPKVKSNHAYGQGDSLCYIGDIQITEGELNAEIK